MVWCVARTLLVRVPVVVIVVWFGDGVIRRVATVTVRGLGESNEECKDDTKHKRDR